MSGSNILTNFLQLEEQVVLNTNSLGVVNSLTSSGSLLVGNGTIGTILDPTTGINGQILKRDTGVLQGVSWSANVGLGPTGVVPSTYVNGSFTVDANGIITGAAQGNINNITPTSVKGEIMVEDGIEIVAFAPGANGTFLCADSAQSTGLNWCTLAYADIKPTGTKGDLISEDNVGPTILSLGTAGQQLCVDLAEDTGMKWVDKPTPPTLEDITPTVTKGDLIVHDNVGDMVALPLGAANDGDILTVDTAVTATCLKWAAPTGGGGGGGPFNVVESVHAGSDITVNITLGVHPHNTMFIINNNSTNGTNFVYNLPPITAAEQGVVYRFYTYDDDAGSGNWQIIPSGLNQIEFTGYVDSGSPTILNYQATNGDPAVFNTTPGVSPAGAYGAGLSIMAFFPASGTPKWIGIGVSNGVTGPGGGYYT